MADWTIDDLRTWDERIREQVETFGLDCYRQEFEVCDHHAMLGYMAYHGMPAHYPHWSYGKSYEKTRTLYDYGVSGLPYELVINSDPCLAYLMQDNSLCLQILTIAHVYGHNDFFKNNFTFTALTNAGETLSSFKTRADRVRRYIEDPSIGDERVELFLDAAHALAFCISNQKAIAQRAQPRNTPEAGPPREPPYAILQKPEPETADEPDRFPPEPVTDILAFIRDHRPELDDWQRDLLDIVDAEARYFLPQIETKIMNEGWASYWHHKLLTSIELPTDVHVEFLVRHNQVVCPHPGSINPYHLGFVLWHKIEERHGPEALWAVRETDRDTAFLRRFLDVETMRELDLFSFEPKGDKLVVTEVADEDHWEEVKRKLISQIGSGTNPVIRITDADFNRRRELYLRHAHDGRDLHLGYAERTLQHLFTLWGRRVLLETRVNGKPTRLAFDADGFDARLVV